MVGTSPSAGTCLTRKLARAAQLREAGADLADLSLRQDIFDLLDGCWLYQVEIES
jgi:hypothetical protein